MGGPRIEAELPFRKYVRAPGDCRKPTSALLAAVFAARVAAQLTDWLCSKPPLKSKVVIVIVLLTRIRTVMETVVVYGSIKTSFSLFVIMAVVDAKSSV